MHDKCVCCSAGRTPLAPEDTVAAVLLMWLVDGITLEELARDLCPAHRRMVEGAVVAALSEEPPPAAPRLRLVRD